MEKDLIAQKNKWLQQEGNLFVGIAQAKCRLEIIIMERETSLIGRSLAVGSEKINNYFKSRVRLISEINVETVEQLSKQEGNLLIFQRSICLQRGS